MFSITQAEKPQKRMNKREAYMRFRRIQSLRHANVRMRLKGANDNPAVVPNNALSGKINYMIGKNPDAWHVAVPNYGQLTYKQVYPGIDMVFRGTRGKVEYDFVVAPRANPRAISIQIDGEKPLWLDARGDLHVETSAGAMLFQKPLIYQDLKGQRKHIDGQFDIRGANEVAISVARYDRSKPLTIDPVLVYSGYLGGTTADGANDIAIDSQSNAYITGWTMSPDFPLKNNPISSPPPGDSSTFTAFVTEFDASGQYLIYSTYLGGSVADVAGGIAVDSNGSAYITGETASSDFPVTTSNCFQPNLAPNAGGNAFLTKISPDGQSLQYSTFLGGSGGDVANKIAVDNNQNAYLVGYDVPPSVGPGATLFPTTTNAFQPNSTSVNGDVFVTRIDTTQAGQNSLIYSTFLGGSTPSNSMGGFLDGVPLFDAGLAIAVDANANVYVAGATQDGDFPITTSTAYESSVNPNGAAFLTRIDTTQAGAAGLIYSTVLSGSAGGDAAYAVALDSSGYTYVAGDAESADFPVTTGVANNTSLGKSFVAKFDTTQSQSASLLYSTLVGGSVGELAAAVAVDPSGRAYVGGFTVSPDFPVTPDALQSAFGTGGENSFLAVLSADASQILYATYLGGAGSDGFDILFGIALDPSPNPNIYIAGVTASANYQTTPTAFQTTLAGFSNCFIAELSPLGGTAPTITSVSSIYDAHGVFAGVSGTTVAINGTNFESVQGSGSVSLGGATAPVSSWSDTSIVVSVPNNAPPFWADAEVNNGFAWSNAFPFVVFPTETSISPSEGPVGATVDISGANLGTLGSVTFNGTSATTSSWSATDIIATVPAGATSGLVQVTTASIPASGNVMFTVTLAPSVSGISPTSGPANTPVTVTGSNFGPAQADENGNVVINGADATISSWGEGSIVALVPVNAAPGTGTVSVNLAGVSSAAYTFTVIPTTNVISPSSGAAGQTVSILGANFGSSQGSGTVQFGSTVATISIWTPTEIDVVVPSISLGATTVTVNAGTINANTQAFTVTSTPTGSGSGAGGSGAMPTDADQTLPPLGGFNGTGPDVVSLQNGNIHISIPLIEVGERAGGTMWYKFIYDTPTYLLSRSVNPNATPSTGSFQYAVSAAAPLTTGWRVTSPLNWSIKTTTGRPFNCPGALPNGLMEASSTSAQDPDGVIHSFGVTQVSGALYDSGQACSQGVGFARALDGSGLLMDTSSGRGLVLKNGSTLQEDTNGNFYESSTCNLSPIFPLAVSCPDTLDRVVLTETLGAPVTFTTPLGKTISWPKYMDLTYTDSNGTSQSFQVGFQALDLDTGICGSVPASAPCSDNDTSAIVPSRLTLPNGNSYQFTWLNNSQAQIQQVQLPTGGSTNYGYTPACIPEGATGTFPQICSMHAISRTVTTGSSTAQWTYTPGTWDSSGDPDAIVTDPYGNDEVHQFTSMNPGQTVETKVINYNGSSASGAVMKTVATTYAYNTFGDPSLKVNIRPSQQTVTLDNGQTRMTQTTYDTFTGTECSINSANYIDCASTTMTAMNPTSVSEYDYGAGAPGALLRTTNYTYLYANNSTYASANMLDRVATKTILNSGGAQVALTQYTYDNYSQPMVSSGAVQHDSTYSTSYTLRGNVTAGGKWRNTDGTFLTTTFQYDDAGNVLSITDPLGNTTWLDYTDSWGDATCAPSGGQGEAYPTTITNALGQLTTTTFNSCTGSIASATDSNQQTTSYTYDAMGRWTSVVAPDGASTTTSYQDSSIPFTATQTQTITSSQPLITTNTYDGLGRIAQTQLTSDTTTSTPPSIAVTYDLLSRKSTVYNPTRCKSPTSNCGESTWGTTTYAYDPLGRINTVTEQDGSQVQYSYSGNTVTVTDEAGNPRKIQTDGLGRLTSVWEVPNGVNYLTAYGYDALNDLTNVTQSGSLQRVFAYDSLRELTSANNPESGTVSYTYDNDGNVSTRIDARGTTTTYYYDALNRIAARVYSDGTPTVKYAYDGKRILGPLVCSINSTGNFGLSVGRRTAMCDGAGLETWSYVDIPGLGMQITDQRTTDGIQETVVSQNNLAGSPATLTYPSGRTITYTPNGAGVQISAQDTTNQITFASNGAYTPAGGLASVSFGTAIDLTIAYNSRLQPCWIYAAVGTWLNSGCTGSATPGNLIDLQFNFGFGSGDNGNVLAGC